MSGISLQELDAQFGEVLPEREALGCFSHVGFRHYHPHHHHCAPKSPAGGALPAAATPPLPAASAAVPPQDLASVQAEALTLVRHSAGLVPGTRHQSGP